jgi:hypothetical protein
VRTLAKLLVAVVIVAALVAVYVVAGTRDASDVEVGQITEESPSYPATAIPYSLPQKTLILSTTTVVTGCVETPRGEVVLGTTSLAVAASVGVDPAQQYYIYFASGSRAKNLDYGVEIYDNGTLKSLALSIKDQVAPLAASALGALAQLAPRLAPLVGAPALAPPPPPNCRTLDAAIKANADDPRLVLRQEDRWTPLPAQSETARYRVSVALERFGWQFQLSAPRWVVANALVELGIPAGLPKEAPEIAQALAGAAPEAASGAAGCADQATSCPPQKPKLVKGLVLRNAVRARLRTRICDGACNAALLALLPVAPDAASRLARPLSSRDEEGLLSERPSSEETMPQFGTRFLVPVHSGFAQDAAATLAMSPDGLITKLQLQSVSALSNSIAAIGGQAGSPASGLTALEPSTVAANRSLADCLTAQKQVTGAGGSPIGTCR